MSQAEEKRRQEEINLFAAMAQGGTPAYGMESMGVIPAHDDAVVSSAESKETGAANPPIATATMNSSSGTGNAWNDHTRNMFAQAGINSDPSGTFKLQEAGKEGDSQSSSGRSFIKSHNLEAAAAALAGDDGVPSYSTATNTIADTHLSVSMHGHFFGTAVNTSTAANDSSNHHSGQTKSLPKLRPRTPMHTQQIFLPKPLFFGCRLPPRVVQEAREIIRTCSSDKPYPPEVRNLISAIRSYGNGIDILSSSMDVNNEEKPTLSRRDSFAAEFPTDYVSVFCPKWSEEFPPGMEIHVPPKDSSPLPEESQVSIPQQPQRSRAFTDPGLPTTAVTIDTAIDPKSENRIHNPHTTTNITTAASVFEPHSDKKIQQQQASPMNPTSTAARKVIGEEAATVSTTTLSADASVLSERDLFSIWARGDELPPITSAAGAIGGSNIASPTNSLDASGTGPERALLSRDNSAGSYASLPRNSSAGSVASNGGIMSDQDLFAQWARGESPRDDGSSRSMLGGGTGNNTNGSLRSSVGSVVSGSSFVFAPDSSNHSSMSGSQVGNSGGNKKKNPTSSSNNTGGINFFNASGTFMNIPMAEDSDDDEVVVSELKKKVGMNEHLNAALASLEADINHNGVNSIGEGVGVDDSTDKLTQVPLTPDGGRPLTNHELMNGVAPLFGCDDSPLPTEADLGIHETRDEQQRSKEQRRNQAIIENFCPQNIFGPLACPNPALHPDDNHSWNSRTIPPARPRLPSIQSGVPRTVSHSKLGVLPTLDSSARSSHRRQTPPGSPTPILSSQSRSMNNSSSSKLIAGIAGKRFDPRARFGWWNVPESEEGVQCHTKPTTEGERNLSSSADNTSTASFEILDLGGDEVQPLQLPPEGHPATQVLVQTNLDPTPSKLQEQNRPLSQLHPATTLAQTLPFLSDRQPSFRYLQIDTQAVGFPALGGEIEPLYCTLAIYHVETIPHNANKDPSVAPIPDLQRCGKVTETLNFDVVSDEGIEQRCQGALWPYQNDEDNSRFRGTRCGVFPLPSNLNMHNLYAILIVHKVISEGTDFEVYLRPNQSASSNSSTVDYGGNIDLEQLKTRAEKASSRQGKFIMPFAFGVAPLLQVFGADVPVVPSSRAVQIPLFRFAAGQGDRQIIDHIMVMLYPRADHKSNGIGGPAPVTNGGTAMLVMRNFGYLGLHSVVHSKSSLARDRLVDFTREMQLRRREDKDKEEESGLKEIQGEYEVHIVPRRHSGFISEPTSNGGRYTQENGSRVHKGDDFSSSLSPLYAQELAPLRLNPNRPSRSATSSFLKSQRGRNHNVSGEDIEPFFHTAFCNEMLCLPRLLHNCPKGNIVVKVELREMEWLPAYGAYLAHIPTTGPAVHNPRRGPALVQGAFSSCSARCPDPQFLDEFKLRLPLILKAVREGTDCNRTTSLFFTVYRLSFSSRKKWGKIFRSKKTGRKVDEIAGDIAGESSQEVNASTNCHLIQLSCGYLPLMSNSSVLVDGNHDIKMLFQAREPKSEVVGNGEIQADTLIVSDHLGFKESGRIDGDDQLGDDSESVGSSYYVGESASATSASESVAMSELTDGSRSKTRSKLASDPIGLQVRIAVHSSIHCQNSVLTEFLSQEPEMQSSTNLQEKLSELRFLPRDDIIRRISTTAEIEESHYDTERLLISTVDISKTSLCPTGDVSNHLLRVVSQLLKVIVLGTGEANLQWANPATLFPLRVQAFATLLHLLGSSTVFFSRRGLTQLDGSNKWNLRAFSRIVALTIGEIKLFGAQGKESVCREFFSPPDKLSKDSPTGRSFKMPQKRGRRHVRSHFEFLNNGETTGSASDTLESLVSEHSKVSESRLSLELEENSKQEERNQSIPEKANHGDRSNDGTILSDFSDSSAASSISPVKVDSVTDFRTALKAGSMEVDNDDSFFEKPSTSSSAALAMIKAYSGPQAASRRWMTAPAPGLATIREDGDVDETNIVADPEFSISRKQRGPLDSLDAEMFVKPSKSTVKQMRVPKTRKNSAGGSECSKAILGEQDSHEISLGPFQVIESKQNYESDPNQGLAVLSFESPSSSPTKEQKPQRPKPIRSRSHTLPATDAEIESAGTSFLDAIEKTLGLGKGTAFGEETRVGQAHHKKTRSKCSIDWSIPNDDLQSFVSDSSGAEKSTPRRGNMRDFDDSMSTLTLEAQISTKLPNFVDRVISLGDPTCITGRWFPFVYEVIIMQWAAVLMEQVSSESEGKNDLTLKASASEGENYIADAASRTTGVAIACAPVLFELIKQSLGWRLTSLKRRQEMPAPSSKFPPLATLDGTLLENLEQIIALITEACIDARNFDAWETRQTCIDVNDSIVRFLRDLFAFLDPSSVYRLIMIYLSRLAAIKGNWQDRDSNIGLRCSWEVTKLLTNAISAFVRFPDFLKVNSPQYNTVNEWLSDSPTYQTVSIFDDMLAQYQQLNPLFLLGGGRGFGSKSKIGVMRPHWLAEIVIDVCILGTEHAEQNIQRRSSSLLLELFWGQSQQSMSEGSSSIVGSMYITFLEKVIGRTGYISSCFSAKSQVRQDILRCVVFVLQSAPLGLQRALWRRLCATATGKGFQNKYGGIGYSLFTDSTDESVHDNQRKTSNRGTGDWRNEANILEMFSLINLSLATLEYDGSDEHAEPSASSDDDGPHVALWRKEFLLVQEQETPDRAKRQRLLVAHGKMEERGKSEPDYMSSGSRKWHCHDCSMVLIKTAQQIVRELRNVLEPSEEAQAFFNPARQRISSTRSHNIHSSVGSTESKECAGHFRARIGFTYMDTVIFVRAATSVYLHSLTLRQSDIVLVRTLNASLEIVKIFGIKIFNEAVGETLQHWMRVVSFHCGSRRAEVRVQASDFLELILRSTWDSFGSFFRIRLPLLAVQTEVMERIVATAAARHYREQRIMGLGIDLFSNGSAEASLTPLWRTLDRLHHQSASQNVAFRSALIRLAEKWKKLFRAYIAAHALSFLNKSKGPGFSSEEDASALLDGTQNLEAQALKRASRISILRVINASAGYSKQFLGFYSTSLEHSTVAHNEAVEDAFLAAADVFSPTELPDHRVAWLRKLAEFHSSRHKFAEEATCHYNIHITLQQASRLHGALWSSTPFLPWTDNMSDGIHLDGEGAAGDPDDTSYFEEPYENDFGRQIEKTNSFRRIFYRNENSIRVSGGELEAGKSKYAFYGVTLPSEYNTVSPWISLREMEASMLEEAESAGDLFLKSGIVASSRYTWSLAVRHYAEKFSYGKLAHVYERLAKTVVSQVPPIDTSLQEVSVTVPLGRFYRVWFHGGAPDELIGAEFVYRTASNVRLEQFGRELKEVIRCIIPDKTPIHLVLDGRSEEREQPTYSGFRMGAQLEPVRVKVTPLRSMVGKSSRMRGLPEWFHDYVEMAFSGQASHSNQHNGQGLKRVNSFYGEMSPGDASRPRHRDHGPTYSASVFASSGSTMGTRRGAYSSSSSDSRRYRQEMYEGDLVGADKFSFMQPISKSRGRGMRDWLRGSSGDFAAKSLRVTQLQVGQAFPACVSRQAVVHRVVFTQSPLEAAVDSICQWCSILFRTAIATNGQVVLGINFDPGIGIEAAKVVSDCIHSSRVKEMGQYLLKKNTNFEEEDEGDTLQSYDRLAEDEVKKLQLRLSRALVVFMELLHLMIARNRDLLLDVIQERKRGEFTSRHGHSSSLSKSDFSFSDMRTRGSALVRQGSTIANDGLSDGRNRDDMSARSNRRRESFSQNHGGGQADDYSISSGIASEKARTDSAIGIQSELQRAFISLSKELHPMIQGIMNSDTPRWLKLCTQENYFSSYTYRQAKIPMGEELVFEDMNAPVITGRPSGFGQANSSRSHSSMEGTGVVTTLGARSSNGTRTPGSPGGSLGSSSVVSRGSEGGRSHQSSKRSLKSQDRSDRTSHQEKGPRMAAI